MSARAIEIQLDGAEAPRGPLERLEQGVGRRLRDSQLVTPAELERARAHQSAVGGRLTSALWELGLVDGITLRNLCGEILKTPCALPADVAMAEPEATSLLSAEFVAEFRVIPFARNRDTLLVATAEPWRLPLLDGIAQRTGCRVSARFVDEAPLSVLIETLYGVAAPDRFKVDPEPRARPSLPAAQEQAETDQEMLGHSGELMSETAFEEIYQSDGRIPPAGLGPAAQPAADPGASHPSAPQIIERALPPLSSSDSSTQPTAALPEATDDPLPLPEKPDPAVSDVLGFEDLWTPEVDLTEAPVSVPVCEAVTPPPLSALAEARAALAACADRDQLAWALQRFVLSRARRTVLLTLRDGVWLGWTGAGAGVEPGRVEALMIPPAPETIFGEVLGSGAPWAGALSSHVLHERFLAAVGGGAPASGAMFPIRYRDRIVLGLYLDGGPGGLLPGDLSDVQALCEQVPAALERLARVVKAKRSG